MTECIPHPDDPSRWLPIDKAWERVWRDHVATLALIEGHGKRLAGTDQSVAALWAAIKAQDAAHVDDMRALGGLVAELSTRLGETVDALAEQGVWVAELEARVKALEPLPSGPAFGVDVSGHQTLAQVQDAAADPVNAFVIVKATEGMAGKSSAYPAQREAAGAKFVGAYHFAWANQDPLKEAANFLTTAALKPGDVAFLDVENWGTGSHPTPEMQATSWAQRLTFTLAWLDEVKAKTGATPVLYANWDWIKNLRTAATAAQWARLTAFPLWLADYSGTGGKHATVTSKDGSNPDSWPIVAHQYAVDTLDRNWTPDIARIRKLAVP